MRNMAGLPRGGSARKEYTMRDLPIAYGNSRTAKIWVNKTIPFDVLKDRLRVPIRTSESAEEYARMSKSDRDNAKDHGGFVFGSLTGGRRKHDTVACRSGVCLDGDHIEKYLIDNFERASPYAGFLYTTHSNTEDEPRARMGFPTTRDMTPEEYVAVSRYVAQDMGIDQFDECSYLPNQLMYFPSAPANGDRINPGSILTRYSRRILSGKTQCACRRHRGRAGRTVLPIRRYRIPLRKKV